MKTYLIFGFLTWLGTSCQSEQREASDAVSSEMAPASARFAPPEGTTEAEALPTLSPPTSPTVPAPPVPRKIIRNAALRFRVRDFRESTARIERAVAQVGGLIASSTESKGDAQLQNDVIVRVPAARLDTFLVLVLRESIYTETKSITAEDVTKRYVDTEARIRSKKATEDTYLQLLKQAKSVKDVLEVEQQLAQMREEIEAQEAVFRELKNDIAQSTVTLTYYEQTETSLNPEEPFYVRIGRNFADGFGLLANAFVGFFYVLPLLAVLAGLVWLVVQWRRGRRA